MALQLKLSEANTINAEGTRILLTDITGNYNSITNPTGYGTPNTSRNQIAVFILGLNKSNKGDKVVSFDVYNPLSSSTFNAIIASDGWYQFNMIGLPLYVQANLGDYNIGEVYYNSSTNKIVRIDQSIYYPPVGFPEITMFPTDIDISELAKPNYTVYIKDTSETFFIANNSKIKLRINAKISDLITNKVDFKDRELIRQKDNYNAVRAILQGAIYEYARGNKYVAQTSIEFLNSNDYLKD